MKTPPSDPYEATPYEIKIYIIRSTGDDFRVMLKHPDGSTEVSHQSWATYKEACAAADQYVREIGAEDVNRIH